MLSGRCQQCRTDDKLTEKSHPLPPFSPTLPSFSPFPRKQKVLQLHPSCPPSVRLGIGLCHLRLFASSAARQPAAARREFHAGKARQALERVLQLEPGNADALVALGLLDVNSDDVTFENSQKSLQPPILHRTSIAHRSLHLPHLSVLPSAPSPTAVTAVQRGQQRMLAAFHAFPFHPMALNHLANHAFLAGPSLHGLVDPLAALALASTEASLPRAEAYYCLARTYHAQGDRKKAFAYYKAATETVQPGEFALPYYGLGQIQLSLGDAKAAVGTLEKVLAVHPTNSDALKVRQGREVGDSELGCMEKGGKGGTVSWGGGNLQKVLAVHPINSHAFKLVGAIHLQQGRQDQALACFRKITQHCPSDMDAWLEVGELLVSSDLPAALESLKKVRSHPRFTAYERMVKVVGKEGVSAYERMVKVVGKEGVSAYERMVKAVGKEGVPWQLVNNIAALQHERGAYEEAVAAYKEALGPHGPWAPILHPEGAAHAAGGGDAGREALPVEKEAVQAYKEALGPHGPWAPILHLEGLADEDERKGAETALPVEKVTVVFNLALSLERTCCLTQAAALHRLILSQVCPPPPHPLSGVPSTASSSLRCAPLSLPVAFYHPTHPHPNPPLPTPQYPSYLDCHLRLTYPSYLDCHLRLAVMALDRRDNATAMTHVSGEGERGWGVIGRWETTGKRQWERGEIDWQISAVLQRAPDSVDALLLRSRAEAERDDHAAAKDTLKRIVDLSPEKCTAALVALVSSISCLIAWRTQGHAAEHVHGEERDGRAEHVHGEERDGRAAAKDTLKGIVDLSPEKCTTALVALVRAMLSSCCSGGVSESNAVQSAHSLGNWNLNMSARPTRDTKAEASFLEKAREMFHKALTGSSSNMYAANGVGSVVAERGLFDVAKDIFTSVQEASSAPGTTDLPDVWMNLANVHLAKGDYALAVKLYEKTLKRFFASGAVGASGAEGFHLRTLSYMARAQYDADQLAQCRRSLLLAVHVAPNNAALRFNVAVALQKMAVTVLKQEKRTAEQVRKVVSDLKTALRLFSQLATRGVQGSQGGVDKKKANSHLEYCQHVLSSAKQHLEVAEREEQQRKVSSLSLFLPVSPFPSHPPHLIPLSHYPHIP
ncbi:unnamed protein product [Closterium sp. NIES-65]|nr:unnamed protein product [Closterium sp. NIES-65]